ncbi:MAG TPA: hypothetical protein VF855_07290 [Acidimicrobiales bacterium]
MRSRLLLTTLWVIATLAATVVAVRGVGVVADNLSGGRSPSLSEQQVDQRLEDLSGSTTAPGASTTAPASSSTSTTASEASTSTASVTTTATTVVTTTSPSTSATTAPHPTTKPTSAPSTTPTSVKVACKAYAKATQGGTLYVTGCPGVVRFEGAQPASGWVVADQDSTGSSEVEVSFRRAGGKPRYDVKARATASGVPLFEVKFESDDG